MAQQDEDSLRRPLSIASLKYSELVAPWEVAEFINVIGTSRTINDLGLIGVALAETFLARPGQITRLQIFLLTTVAFLLIMGLGIFLANRITRPLMRVVEASTRVAKGDLEVQVEAAGKVLGRNCRFMQAGEDNDAALARLRAALAEGRECSVTLVNRRRDGSRFVNELHVAPVRDALGRLTHYIGVQHDVTDRTRAAQQLELSEALFGKDHLTTRIAQDTIAFFPNLVYPNILWRPEDVSIELVEGFDRGSAPYIG